VAALCAGALVAGALAWHQRVPVLWIGLGAAYLASPGLALIWLRGLPQVGLQVVIWLLAVVWATDIVAYLVGRAVGGPRLAPHISPGKTWSGLCGGVVAAALAGTVTAGVTGSERLLHAAGLGGLLAIVAQIGDLIESALKRRAGVKDSGSLIPGHGGVLDRLDGLMLAAPVLALLALALGPEVLPWP
jgi:phosphatidate cytidylyltransferase